MSAETVAMSTPHTIDYTLYFDSSTMKEKSGDDASGGSPAGTASSAAADFHNADLGCGWEPTGTLQLEYAKHFTVDEFEGRACGLSAFRTGSASSWCRKMRRCLMG